MALMVGVSRSTVFAVIMVMQAIVECIRYFTNH